MNSPYQNKPVTEWKSITENLLAQHPLDKKEIVQIILNAWECILQSKICGLQIGKDVFPSPQMMGFFIESLTAAKLAEKHPNIWKHGKGNEEKDVVCLTNDSGSIEIKTSSDRNKIFGNRSYAQAQSEQAKKGKSGYYLAINFEKFKRCDGTEEPKIGLIRFGYLEHSDWRGQKSEKGQQANLSPEVYKNKFIVLYERPKPEKQPKKA